MSSDSNTAPPLQYEFHTNTETAAILHCTVRQVERWSANGRLGSVHLGHKTLHTTEQIAAFVAANTRDAVI